ncbi:hypothetical protein FPQ18DRAFT_308583 [Pyronema domesticum]|nr:hypothetical protein FPQ18DRAFT_308583 [Pyronema domesticum]
MVVHDIMRKHACALHYATSGVDHVPEKYDEQLQRYVDHEVHTFLTIYRADLLGFYYRLIRGTLGKMSEYFRDLVVHRDKPCDLFPMLRLIDATPRLLMRTPRVFEKILKRHINSLTAATIHYREVDDRDIPFYQFDWKFLYAMISNYDMLVSHIPAVAQHFEELAADNIVAVSLKAMTLSHYRSEVESLAYDLSLKDTHLGDVIAGYKGMYDTAFDGRGFTA